MRALVLLVVLGLAAPALAGTVAVADPFDVSGCGATDWVGTQMGDPNGAFAGILDCPGLCRLAEQECLKLTKLSFSCQNLIVSKRATWSKSNCKATLFNDDAALKQCKLDAKSQASADKQAVSTALKSASASCAEWSSTCQATCLP